MLAGCASTPAKVEAQGDPEHQYVTTVRAVAVETSKFDDTTLLAIGNAVCDQPTSTVHGDLVKELANYRQVSLGAAGSIVSQAVFYLCPDFRFAQPYQVTTTTAPPAIAAVAPGPAESITAREWQQIAKDPTGHAGNRIVVFGKVTQFDAATGLDGSRANVDGVKHPVRYGYADYETNTVLVAADRATIAELVEKDLFRAEVTVIGAYSYTTAMGGTMTAPQLRVTAVEVIGTSK